MRVYLPTTMTGLRTVLDAGEVDVEVGYAVTPALREWYVEGDQEELEYAATAAAARASLRLIAMSGTPQGGDLPRRVVLAAEVPEGQARPAGDLGASDRAAVRLAGPLPLRLVDAALVDDPAGGRRGTRRRRRGRRRRGLHGGRRRGP